MSPPRIAAAIPFALTSFRLALAPVMIMLALRWPSHVAFALCLNLAFLSDFFDGVLARRLGVATENLRRFDSFADTVFYLSVLCAVWVVEPWVLRDTWAYLGALLFLEASRYVLDFWKFGREASYHMWSAKIWGVLLFIAAMAVLVAGKGYFMVYVCLLVGIASDAEGLLISLLLPAWRHDVPSVLHAWRLRIAAQAR